MKTIKRGQQRQIQSKRKLYTRRRRGGKVIGSGGYGCVFRPALKCKGHQKRSSKSISKLMSVKHAKREYMGIIKYLPILQKIPNYTNYFIIKGANLCHPAPLTKSDLNHFNLNCKPLKKRNINAKNINKSLDKVYSLNLPDGGIELGEYIDSRLSIDDIKFLNIHMIQLLVYGILPMNKYHVYHADIKESNILIDAYNTQTMYVRLIDWGLSAYTTGSTIPDVMWEKPFQYNLPFSIVLFNNTFKTMYDEFLNTGHSITNDSISVFLKRYIDKWLDIRGLGHMNTITSIWQLITNEKDIQKIIIIPYLSAILIEYTRNGKFDMIEYFKNVFLGQIDIWGFIMTYSAYLETGYTNYKINNLLITYLFKTPINSINIDHLVLDLNNLF